MRTGLPFSFVLWWKSNQCHFLQGSLHSSAKLLILRNESSTICPEKIDNFLSSHLRWDGDRLLFNDAGFLFEDLQTNAFSPKCQRHYLWHFHEDSVHWSKTWNWLRIICSTGAFWHSIAVVLYSVTPQFESCCSLELIVWQNEPQLSWQCHTTTLYSHSTY